ncbi:MULTISPECIES: TetR family transcriptional regulator [unclassified Mycobacterium]|uniref:TetR family transcriptional regulator n=1 Tax=unclassified Mycobacterium TaxID=2642494 RepID=UPI0007FDAE23|nr:MULTISPECIES: TetR family transcriptional regulator [unclassified Mycobacterium]OBI14114.1 TetR family transcriptional regulator [Mycobacterium sp. E2497]
MRNTTELRQEILAAARSEFAAYGLAGARIDRIARTAQASKERLYAHFGDKETLFREVVVTDAAEFFRSFQLRPEAIPEFVGDVYDVACSHPEFHRMITWSRLEGVTLEEPPVLENDLATIAAAQAGGHVDPAWQPMDLMVLLFGIALAWANSPLANVPEGARVIARRRAAAVEAAARLIAPRAT